MATAAGPSIRAVWDESWALVMHTFVTLLEAEGLEHLSEYTRDLDRAALSALAFHEPKRLEEERKKHRARVRRLAGAEARRPQTPDEQRAAIDRFVASMQGMR